MHTSVPWYGSLRSDPLHTVDNTQFYLRGTHNQSIDDLPRTPHTRTLQDVSDPYSSQSILYGALQYPWGSYTDAQYKNQVREPPVPSDHRYNPNTGWGIIYYRSIGVVVGSYSIPPLGLTLSSAPLPGTIARSCRILGMSTRSLTSFLGDTFDVSTTFTNCHNDSTYKKF